VYLSLVKAPNGKGPANEFELIFGNRKLELDATTHIRLELEGTEAKLAVLDGEVRVEGDEGVMSIAKKRTATFDLVAKDEPSIAKDVDKTLFDAWDHNATSYHSGVAALSAYSSPYAYGTSDMAYFGAFTSSLCGSMWRPYFASAGWDPFANGSWAYYQGSGYSWVSPYPWAWTPYHTGAWSYCPDRGWGWMPTGGEWYGLNNSTALIAKKTAGGSGFPRLPPPHAPRPHQPSVIAANSKTLIASDIESRTSFVFRKDSAGLGVPRGTLGHLEKLSRQTESHGVAKTAVYIDVPPPSISRGDGKITMAQAMGASIHRGYAPSSTYSSSSSYSGGSSGGSSSISSSASSGRSSVGPSPSAPSAPSGGGGVHK
jgi:hypothetical protein